MPVVQRLLPVGAVRRTHADCHEAAVGYGGWRRATKPFTIAWAGGTDPEDPLGISNLCP